MRLRGMWLLCAPVGAFLLTSSAYGQVADTTGNTTIALEQASREEQAQKEAMAESIVAREEAQSGRSFDPAFRARAKEALASLPLSALEAQQSQIGLGTNALGDTGADLVYTPITPCRIIDTRLGGGAIAANFMRSFFVAGTTGFPAQGGETGGCGVPLGATSAMINFVAVNGVAPGDLRVTPFGAAMPLASIVNWALGSYGLNLANGLAVKLCDPAVTTCPYDIILQADASAIDIVADVQGYFRRASGTPYFQGGETSGSVTNGVGAVYNAVGVNIGGATRCLLTVTPVVSASGTPLSTGNPLVYPTWRVNGTAVNHAFGPWCFMSIPASSTSYYNCTTAGVALPTGSATNTYDFGCSYSLTSTYTGGVFCHATVICFP